MTPTAIADAVPSAVLALTEVLRTNGHATYVVGGCLRDVVLGRAPHDWDLTTDARPERLQELFPGALYENRFGTVTVRAADDEPVEITTFRSDQAYEDFRRPVAVEFGERIEDDLARRDFTVNAMAWGGAPEREPAFVDPFGGRADAEGRTLRAVGDPAKRFGEDALRMLRAVRLAATLDFSIEEGTLAAISEQAGLATHLSGERIAAEVDKLLAAERPSVGLRLLAQTGLLAAVAPELAAQVGITQNKVAGEDLWDHTIRSVDAAAAAGFGATVRMAALLHDIGKPATAADGHFYGHEREGADLARALLERLRYPKPVVERVGTLVRQHMFAYEATWTDAALRRFIAKVGRETLDDLFALRAADNVGSGVAPDGSGLGELRRRVAEQLAADVALERGDLAVNGDDLMAELGLQRGPAIGRILDQLLERVVAEPSLNDRPTLLLVARGLVADDR